MNSNLLNTLAQLVATGALGTSVVCMILGAVLLHSAYEKQKNGADGGALLSQMVAGIRMYMIFTTIFLILGLSFHIVDAFIKPKINVSYIITPEVVPEPFKRYAPTVFTMVDGVYKAQPVNTMIPEHDQEIIFFKYDQLIEFVRTTQKADAYAQGQTNDAGP